MQFLHTFICESASIGTMPAPNRPATQMRL